MDCDDDEAEAQHFNEHPYIKHEAEARDGTFNEHEVYAVENDQIWDCIDEDENENENENDSEDANRRDTSNIDQNEEDEYIHSELSNDIDPTFRQLFSRSPSDVTATTANSTQTTQYTPLSNISSTAFTSLSLSLSTADTAARSNDAASSETAKRSSNL